VIRGVKGRGRKEKKRENRIEERGLNAKESTETDRVSRRGNDNIRQKPTVVSFDPLKRGGERSE